MSKTLIIYSSTYGTTKEYAEWIAKELNGDIYSISNFEDNILNNYNTIIIGCGLYPGKNKGVNIITRNYEILKNKKLIIFTCGLADYSKLENKNAIFDRLKKEFSEKIIEKIRIFYLRGGINYKKLTLKHKIMMLAVKIRVLKKGVDKLNEEDKEFMETYGKVIYFMDKNSINELVEYCK
jgi:menaquinone-dependent protoporphyrinogen IX oxidase